MQYHYPVHKFYSSPFLSFINDGKKTKTPKKDIIKPPIVPAARGNQKPSFSPIIKGINPIIVDTVVKNIGVILALIALIKALYS